MNPTKNSGAPEGSVQLVCYLFQYNKCTIQICSVCLNHNQVISSFMTYHRVCNKSNTMGATCGAGTEHPSGAPEFLVGFMLLIHK
jgi:hypothetical protein